MLRIVPASMTAAPFESSPILTMLYCALSCSSSGTCAFSRLGVKPTRIKATSRTAISNFFCRIANSLLMMLCPVPNRPRAPQDPSQAKVFAHANSDPQALKRESISSDLAARVELVPFPFVRASSFSAGSEAVPFQDQFKCPTANLPEC